jgi:hypothetical protein
MRGREREEVCGLPSPLCTLANIHEDPLLLDLLLHFLITSIDGIFTLVMHDISVERLFLWGIASLVNPGSCLPPR